jgi:hypothetical protein
MVSSRAYLESVLSAHRRMDTELTSRDHSPAFIELNNMRRSFRVRAFDSLQNSVSYHASRCESEAGDR